MAGPGKKPQSLKKVAGTERPDRDSTPTIQGQSCETVPPPPAWLRPHAAADWEYLAPLLQANGLLFKTNLKPLAILCALGGQIQDSYEQGEPPQAFLVSQYRALFNDFGMTPVAMGRIKPIGSQESGNPFDDLDK